MNEINSPLGVSLNLTRAISRQGSNQSARRGSNLYNESRRGSNLRSNNWHSILTTDFNSNLGRLEQDLQTRIEQNYKKQNEP